MARANRYVSYLAAEIEPKAVSTLNQFEALTEKTFARIEGFASRSGSQLGIGTAFGPKARSEIVQTGSELRKTTSDLNRTGAAARTAATQGNALATSFFRAGQALNVVQGPLGPLAGRLSALGYIFRDLAGFSLAGVLGGGGAFALGAIATGYQRVTDRLRPYYETQSQANSAMREVIGIAQRTRQALDPIAELYNKINVAGKANGVTGDLGRLTETVAKAARLSGGNEQTQSAGLTQFGQGFGSGTLGGDELKSIRENTFRLAKALADGLGVPIAMLKELGAAGKLTPQVIAEALSRSAGQIDLEFSRLPLRVNQALTAAGNNLGIFIGRLDETTHTTEGLAKVINLLANNIPAVATAGTGLIAALNAKGLVDQFRTVERVIDGIAVKQVGTFARFGGFLATQKAALASELAFNRSVREGTSVIIGSAQAEAQRTAFIREKIIAQHESVLATRAEQEATRAQLRTQLQMLAQQREQAIAARTALESSDTSAAAAGAQERLGILKAELASRVELEAAAARQVQALRTGGNLISRNPDLSDARRTALLATNADAAAAAQLNLGKSQVLAAATARQLAIAEAELAAILSGDLAAANALIAEQNSLIATTTAARIRTEQVLAGVNLELAVTNEAVGATAGAAAVAEAAMGAAALAASAEVAAASAINVVATRVMAGMSAAVTGLIGFVGGPWGVAFIAAATAVTYLATRTSAAKEAVDNFKGGQEELERQLGLTTGKLQDQSAAARDLAVALSQANVAKARTSVIDSGNDLGKTLNQAAGNIGTFLNAQQRQDQRDLLEISRRAKAGDFNFEKDFPRVAQIQSRNPSAFEHSTLSSILGADPADYAIKTKGAAAANLTLQQSLEDLKATRDELAKPTKQAPILSSTSVTKKDIDAAIQAKLATTDLQKARASLAVLQSQADSALKTGGVAAYAEYADRLTDAKRAVNDASAAEKAARAAHAAGARAVREHTAAVKDQISREEQLQNILQRYSGESSPYNQGKIAQNKIDALFQKVTKGGAVVQIPTITVDGEALTKAEAIARVVEGMNKPYNDLVRNQSLEIELQGMRLLGMGNEADLLKQRIDLETTLSRKLLPEELAQLRGQQAEQQALNDKIAERNRLVDIYGRAIGQTQAAVRDLIAGSLNGDGDAVKNFGKALKAAYVNAVADKISVSLFGDAEQKFRDDMTRGINDSASRLTTAAGNLDQAATALTAASRTPASQIGSITPGVTSPIPYDLSSLMEDTAVTIGGEIASSIDDAAGDIIVSVKKLKPASDGLPNSVNELFNRIGSTFGIKLFGSSSPLTKATSKLGTLLEGYTVGSMIGGTIGGQTGAAIGGGVGTAIVGLGELVQKAGGSGAVAEGLGNLSAAFQAYSIGSAIGTPIGELIAGRGKKKSDVKKGAMIGGALGAVAGIPGIIIGSILGAITGGIFATTIRGGANIRNTTSAPTTFGNDQGAMANANTLAGSVQQSLIAINQALGGTLGAFNVSIGTFRDRYRVSTTGYQGSLDFNHASGLHDFGEDGQAEAVRFAIITAIEQGAVTGIRQGALRLLRAGQDLESQLDKALKFQNVFTRLKEMTDPVGAAIDKLNSEFTDLINIFNEAGASQQEFADLQQLYDLERADAIKNATNGAVQQLQDFINGMTNSSASPLNKRTVYNNASAEVDKFRADIAAGKVVDQDALIQALQDFQDASRALNGSTGGFFTDFNDILALAEAARANITAGAGTGTLPDSPFGTPSGTPAPTTVTDPATIDAIADQTETLADLLRRIVANTSGNASADAQSAIALLPGLFSKAG